MLSLTRKVHPSRTRDLDVPLVIEIDRLHSVKGSTWFSDLSKILADIEADGHWQRQAYAS